jgi:dolichyl-phosphate-mannose-protein mannosyltransferase
LLLIGVLTHAVWFGHPNSAVFDEVHFGKFISAYFTHQYYFDIHPPLGKLVLAGWGWLWGYTPGFSFANIGEIYPDNLYMALRFLPMLAGALLPLLIFAVGRQLGLSRPAATCAGILVGLDNALLVQSRLILLDSFLLLFGFGAIYFWLRFRNGPAIWPLAAAGILGGAAMCIKWTGMTFLAVIVLWEIWDGIGGHRQFGFRRLWPATRIRLAYLVLLPLLTYAIPFLVHFSLLTTTGSGDAFMSARFQHTLTGNMYASDSTLAPISTVGKIAELNTEMYRSNQRLTASHPYSSKWYTWPLMLRPIFYWVQDTSRIYLLGNPVVWWGSTIAVLITLLNILFAGLRTTTRAPLIMAGAWAINLLPFVGISRVMFLYHYFTALIWAILMLAYLVDQSKHTRTAVMSISVAALALFIFFAPLSYGLPLTDASYSARVWFSSWR